MIKLNGMFKNSLRPFSNSLGSCVQHCGSLYCSSVAITLQNQLKRMLSQERSQLNLSHRVTIGAHCQRDPQVEGTGTHPFAGQAAICRC